MVDSPDKTPVGVVGLGLMGTAFCHRLIEAGFEVVGYDVEVRRSEELAKRGGVFAGSLAELALRSNRIIIAVLNMDQVAHVVESKDGILAHLPDDAKRRIMLSTSTVEPTGIEQLAARVASTRHRLLDAPASGTSLQVQRGESLGLLAGDPEAMAACDDVLNAIYPRRRHVGEAGAATKTKLAINHILGLNRIALAEGLVFAERLGLDLETFFDVARESAAYSQVMDHKGHKMIAGDYDPISKVSPHLKDVRTILREAERCGQALPLASVLANVLEACERHGDGDADNAVMIEEIRRRKANK